MTSFSISDIEHEDVVVYGTNPNDESSFFTTMLKGLEEKDPLPIKSKKKHKTPRQNRSNRRKKKSGLKRDRKSVNSKDSSYKIKDGILKIKQQIKNDSVERNLSCETVKKRLPSENRISRIIQNEKTSLHINPETAGSLQDFDLESKYLAPTSVDIKQRRQIMGDSKRESVTITSDLNNFIIFQNEQSDMIRKKLSSQNRRLSEENTKVPKKVRLREKIFATHMSIFDQEKSSEIKRDGMVKENKRLHLSTGPFEVLRQNPESKIDSPDSKNNAIVSEEETDAIIKGIRSLRNSMKFKDSSLLKLKSNCLKNLSIEKFCPMNEDEDDMKLNTPKGKSQSKSNHRPLKRVKGLTERANEEGSTKVCKKKRARSPYMPLLSLERITNLRRKRIIKSKL